MKLTSGEILTKGFFPENPLIRGIVGLCPLLALSTTLREAALVSAALVAVLLATNLTISLLRAFLGAHYRLTVFIIVAAVYTALAQAAAHALWGGLAMRLGIFLPLLAVNEIVLGRAGAFARHQTAGHSAVDAIGIGLGFSGLMIAMSVLRELLGLGTVWGFPILGEKWHSHAVTGFALPFGAFLTVGLGLGFLGKVRRHA